MAKKFTEKHKDYVKKNFLSKGIRELSEDLGVSTTFLRFEVEVMIRTGEFLSDEYTDKDLNEIRELERVKILQSLEENKYTAKELGEKLKLSDYYARKLAEKYEFKYIKGKVRQEIELTEFEKKYVKNNLLKVSLPEMAKNLNISETHLRIKISKIYGDKKISEIRDERRHEICKKIKPNQYTLAEIAALLGITTQWVTQYIQKHNIKYKRKKIDRTVNNDLKTLFYTIPEDDIDLKNETFLMWFRRWFHTYRDGSIREVTRQHYYNTYQHIERSDMGHKLLTKVNRAHVQNYANIFGSVRSKNTVLDHMQLVRSAFKDAVLDGHIKVNPAGNVKITYKEQRLSIVKRKEMRDEKKWLEVGEYQKFKEYLVREISNYLSLPPSLKVERVQMNQTYHLTKLMVIYVGLKTGARFSEILGIRKNDVYPTKPQHIVIDKTWNHKKIGDATFEPTKTISSIREVYIDEETTNILMKYIEWLETHDVDVIEGSLFNVVDRDVYNGEVNRILKSMLESINIQPISMHKLRHTMASYLIAKGIDLMVVAKRLGHTDTSMVMKVYGHLLEETEDAHNEKILQLL